RNIEETICAFLRPLGPGCAGAERAPVRGCVAYSRSRDPRWRQGTALGRTGRAVRRGSAADPDGGAREGARRALCPEPRGPDLAAVSGVGSALAERIKQAIET